MKFKSDPGRVLTDGRTHRTIGKFDENGAFETTDPYYIERLKLLFTVADEAIIQQPLAAPGCKPEAAKSFYCKTCNLTFDSQGDFLKHTRTAEHKAKKEEKK
jgi:hypothetical protein